LPATKDQHGSIEHRRPSASVDRPAGSKVVSPLEVRHGRSRQAPEYAVDREVRQRQQLIQAMLNGCDQRPLVPKRQDHSEAGAVRDTWISGDMPEARLAARRRDRGRQYRPSGKRRADRERDALLAPSGPSAEFAQSPPLT
jgi:hypothetical protein